MKKSSKAPIFLAAKQSYFTEKMQLLPGEKKITFFSEKSRISIFKIQCKEKDEKIRIVNIFSRIRKTYKKYTSFIQSSHVVGQIVPGN